MGTLKFEGSLNSGPQSSADGTFPSMQVTTVVATTPAAKSFQQATGTLVRRVSVAAPSWQTLSGIGAGDTVTEADFLYLRSDAAIRIRLTQVDGQTTQVTQHLLQGLMVFEPPSSCPITLVEAQGTASIEYYAQGQK